MSLRNYENWQNPSYFNYYALELLYSAEKTEPTQCGLDRNEYVLEKIKRFKKFQPFNIKALSRSLQKTIMLYQEQPLLAYANSNILKNLGFQAIHNWNLNLINQSNLYFYD